MKLVGRKGDMFKSRPRNQSPCNLVVFFFVSQVKNTAVWAARYQSGKGHAAFATRLHGMP